MQVSQLWRYPVKSLRGERLEVAEVTVNGLVGDRARAVVDPDSGVSLSAKRHGELLTCRAWNDGGEVWVEMPGGSQHPADAPETSSMLSSLLGRLVEIRTAVGGERIRHEYVSDNTTGRGDPTVVEALSRTAFFDGSPVHLLTTATLRQLSRHQPESEFAVERFRPNLVIETEEEGFVEANWVGQEMAAGAVVFSVVADKTRCVMTTRAQGALPRDLNVFRTVNRINDRRAGVDLEPRHSGVIRVGDPATVS